jgi:hypothetical protein
MYREKIAFPLDLHHTYSDVDILVSISDPLNRFSASGLFLEVLFELWF